MSQHLPPHPNLGHLKKQAKDVLRVGRHRNPQWRLTDAQQAVAHGYGFSTWPALKLHVEATRQQRGAALDDPRMHEDATGQSVQSHSRPSRVAPIARITPSLARGRLAHRHPRETASTLSAEAT